MLVAAVLAAPAAGSPRIAARTAAAAEPCGPTGSAATTLLRSRTARVYKYRDRSSDRGYFVSACVVGDEDGIPYSVDTGISSYAFLPPAMTLTGNVLGYAVSSCDFSAGGDGCDTEVVVVDLARSGSASTGILYRGHAGPRRVAKVGSLRAAPTGAVAWIACPERAQETQIRASRRPGCVRPGRQVTVYVASPGGKRRAIARGRRIDPSSLRRAGTRITWREAGRRRSTALR